MVRAMLNVPLEHAEAARATAVHRVHAQSASTDEMIADKFADDRGVVRGIQNDAGGSLHVARQLAVSPRTFPIDLFRRCAKTVEDVFDEGEGHLSLPRVDAIRPRLFQCGHIAQVRRSQSKPTSSASFCLAMNLSFAYGRLGETAEALRGLETSIERREDAAIHMLTNPAYDSIRIEPRFLQLLTRLNLEQYVTALVSGH